MAGERLDIDGLSKRYGDVVALQDLSFDVRAGELFGFVGSNGAGKTTTMRVILGVLSADGGEVRWAGRPLTLRTRRQIGYMPEERGLYPKMKVGEQLAYLARLHGMSPRAARSAVRTWTERLGVADRLGDEVQKLSMGNQQRVQLAASLVHDPKMLVLDEPFAGLDPVAVEVMSGVLREKADLGTPVLFSSHQLDLVERVCDRVGIIQGGRMVAVGSVGELRTTDTTQLVVVAPAARAGWADGLPGVRSALYQGGTTSVVLDPGADDQVVLHRALRTGPVHEFARRRPSLTELFRHVVGAAGGAAPLAAAAPHAGPVPLAGAAPQARVTPQAGADPQPGVTPHAGAEAGSGGVGSGRARSGGTGGRSEPRDGDRRADR